MCKMTSDLAKNDPMSSKVDNKSIKSRKKNAWKKHQIDYTSTKSRLTKYPLGRKAWCPVTALPRGDVRPPPQTKKQNET